MRRCILLVLGLFVLSNAPAWAWGQEGHSIIAEIAQRRLSPDAAMEVARLLGPGHSLASIGSWADDVRDERPETYNWHFVDIPLDRDRYDPAIDCKADAKGDCVVAELERLRADLRCAGTDDQKREALKFAVHFVGDIHQPLHTVLEEVGGNTIQVTVNMHGSLSCKGKPCAASPFHVRFHAFWDTTVITKTTWDWGAYVDRLENGWRKDAASDSTLAAGSFTDWAEQTHTTARTIWKLLPQDRVLDDAYYQAVLPIADKQLGLAGMRLARMLNEAYASIQCPRRL